MTPEPSAGSSGRSDARTGRTSRTASPFRTGVAGRTGSALGAETADRTGVRLGEAAGAPHGSPALALVAALLGFFVVSLDASIVSVALPAIGGELHGGLTALQWVVDGYTLALAALMLSTGALSDRVGAGRAFCGGVVLFTAASAACGLAPGLAVLVGARVVQGAAAAVVLPSSLALVRQAFPDAAGRGRAISLWAAGGSVAVALGPVAGGALTSAWSWRGIFFVNLPVGAVALLLAARTGRSPRRRTPLDLPGQATAVVALAALTYAVIEGGRAGLLAGAVAAVAFAGFLRIESRHPHPVVPLGLFGERALTVSLAAGAAVSFAFFGAFFALSLYFQQVRGESALTTGLLFLPMTMLISSVNVISGKAADRYGPRAPMAVGQAVAAGGLLLLLTAGAGTPSVLVALAMIPFGAGAAFAVPALTAAAMGAVAAERAGMAAGLLNACRQVAAGLSVAVFGSLVSGTPHGFRLAGLHEGFAAAALLLALTAGFALRASSHPPRPAP
ncbi:MFS transporter, DHA2 family, methylenomycin A resistance protein [Actinacidiphila guanduensis]|uniref:MFS transporter, DHA2 family, methylenomycin A resistance protein n=1 Tax=Actinacidiphila guanduensis TaxID=310781 RepID=A0A1H0E3V2_9ACTN|nr:MFS transporter, DHA2 family, methylenomycin A resistance protein [Actinacidiphila guanduensis]